MLEEISFVGEIRMFAGSYAPEHWAFCHGQLLPANFYQTLYSVIGNKFGGEALKNFALPDLRGCAPVHQPQKQGQKNGDEAVPTLRGTGVDIKMTPENSINFIICLEGIYPIRGNF